MNTNIGGIATRISADILLVHAPAFFDFRNQDQIYFPFLSTSGDVPITPLYEYFPLGFKTLQKYLGDRGYDVKIVNLSTLLLKYPGIDLESILKTIDAKVFGVDLHWMVHVQGSLEIASLLKKIHPDSYVMLGGISATYYAEELIRYPFIDFVMRGYDTHTPMVSFMSMVQHSHKFESVPNLVWKKSDGEIVVNPLAPAQDKLHVGIDWSNLPSAPKQSSFPIKELLATSTVGCTYNCGWCGGSREAFQRINRCHHPIAQKESAEIDGEFHSMRLISDIDKYHLYSVGAYNESGDRFHHFLEQIATLHLKSISYEQYHLTSDDLLKKMVAANGRTVITLSPESHDLRISKLAGRGAYMMDEMEAWIERALDYGIYQIDIWFFIGMPEQDRASVFDTVAYCERLLKRFKGKRVVPLLCPMIPFLDPGSTFFEKPSQYGYSVFFKTVEEHRQGMMRASLIHRINYETRWLERKELVKVSYQAIRQLFQIKGEHGFLPNVITSSVINKIDDALRFIHIVHEIDCIADEGERVKELGKIAGEIRRRNDEVFYSGVSNQAFPIHRAIGGRWFDELLWDFNG